MRRTATIIRLKGDDARPAGSRRLRESEGPAKLPASQYGHDRHPALDSNRHESYPGAAGALAASLSPRRPAGHWPLI
eukprot:46109-Hanusia_phi.AAC.2